METIVIDLESLFEEHKHLIKITIHRNRPLLAALRLEDEDVAQQLAIKMLSAIRKYDPERSASLAAYIRYALQYEILNIKRRYKPHGITGSPKGYRLDFLDLDYVQSDDCAYDVFSDDDVSNLYVSELFESLTEAEAEAVELRLRGYPLRRKVHAVAMDGVRRRYAELFGEGAV